MEAKKTKIYIETIGRRKTSTARVRISAAPKTTIMVNGKESIAYFPTKELQAVIHEAFEVGKADTAFAVSAKVVGGGTHSQAEAVRHGIARALVEHDEELHTIIKKAGFLKRDPRAKERRKFGLKKARKAPQWSKR